MGPYARSDLAKPEAKQRSETVKRSFYDAVRAAAQKRDKEATFRS